MSLHSAISNFGDALGSFKTAISIVETPLDWLDANLGQIRAAVEVLPSDLHGELANIGFIYPVGDGSSLLSFEQRLNSTQRFSMYTLAHLTLCVKNPR